MEKKHKEKYEINRNNSWIEESTHEKYWKPLVGVPADLQTALGIADFARGIANGTTITSTPGLKLCEAAGLSSYTGVIDAYNTINGNYSIAAFLVGFDQLLLITYNSDNLNVKCTQGYYEAVAASYSYGDIFQDPSFFGSNLLYNIGLMYNAVVEVVTYTSDMTSKSKSSFDAGFQAGAFFYYLLIRDSIGNKV